MRTPAYIKLNMNNAVPNQTKNTRGPKFRPTPEAIQDEITFALGRPEFAAVSQKLKAMANQHGQRLEQSFTELQQLELTPLQRQWAEEQTQTLRLLPAER